MGAMMSLGAANAADITRWFSPNGTGDGTTSSNPRLFSASYINTTLLADTSYSVVRIHLLGNTTNDYVVTQRLEIPSRTDRSTLKVVIEGFGSYPEDVRLVNFVAPNSGAYPFPDYVIAFNTQYQNTTGLPAPGELVVKNLLVDGNWDWKMAQIPHAGVGQGYKNSPLNLFGKTGWVKQVIVRNFGAIGYAPFHRFAGEAGVETFPFVAGGDDTGQALPTGYRRPWVIQECEVHGFNSIFGGYTTELMAHGRVVSGTPSWASSDTTRRFITVQQSQFRSGTDGAFVIATGSAGNSGRATLTDNVIVNASLGYNADTGAVRYTDITNSVGLGTWWWARVDNTPAGQMTGFDISGNTVRLGPKAAFPVYRSYCWNSTGSYTDPSLVLGRPETNNLFSGAVIGTVDNVRFDRNRFTTIPAARFDETDPGSTSGVYRPFYKSPSTSASCSGRAYTYLSGANYGFTGNRVSSNAWDFTSLQSLADGTYSSFDSTTFPAMTTNRAVLSSTVSGFVPYGRVERVLPVWTTITRSYVHRLSSTTYATNSFDDPALAGTREVAMGVPSVGSGGLSVPVRLVLHQTPLSGSGTTVPSTGQVVWLKASGAINATGSATTDSTGLGTITISTSGVVHGEVILTAFYDPRPGASGSFDPYQVAWSKGAFPIGTVVDVVATPDVAVDRREGSVQSAQFVLRRSGPAVVNSSTYPALDVSFELPQPSGGRNATLTTDYNLTAVSPTTRTLGGNPVGPHTVRFAAGSTTAVLSVTPVTDNTIEKEVIRFRLLSGTGCALAARSQAQVYVYDGPEWTLVELTHSADPYSGVTRAAGINDDVDGSNNPDPRIAGDAYVMRTNSSGAPVYGFVGGSWKSTWSNPTALIDTTLTPPLAPVVTGIGNYSGGWFGMSGYKGEADGGTRAIKADQNSWWYLGVPSSSQNEGWYVTKNKGLCISPNKTYVGGYSYAWRVAGVSYIEKRPVGWNGATFIDLGAEDFANDTEGQALAVNDQGEFVGERILPDLNGAPTFRAFRTRPGGQSIAAQDLLPPPSQTGYDDPDIPTVARAIGPGTSTASGVAVGEATKFGGLWDYQVLPVKWTARTSSSGVWNANGAGVFGFVDSGTGVRHASWLAMTPADGSGEFFGWEQSDGDTETSASWWPRENGYSVRLDDAFAVMGVGTGGTWKLSAVIASTSSRRLLVQGKKNGAERAILLLPQTYQP